MSVLLSAGVQNHAQNDFALKSPIKVWSQNKSKILSFLLDPQSNKDTILRRLKLQVDSSFMSIYYFKFVLR